MDSNFYGLFTEESFAIISCKEIASQSLGSLEQAAPVAKYLEHFVASAFRASLEVHPELPGVPASAQMSHILPADRLKGNEENVWVEFVGLVMKHEALNLGQGFTDFCPPSSLTDELSKVALSSDYRLNQYTRGFGYVPLVEVLARFYSNLLGHRVDPLNEVLITGGAYQALFYAAFGFINSGDEAIIIEPYYDCYEPQVRMAGGRPVFVPLRLKTRTGDRTSSRDYVLDIEELESVLTEKTKLLYLNNPMNPTGKVYTRRELESIADIVKRHNLTVISDEVYEWLIYEDSQMIRFASLPDMWDRTITIGSVGKTFSLTGWKTGWAICPSHLMVPLRNVHQNCVYTCNTAVQAAVANCFENQLKLYPKSECYFLEMPRILQPKRDLLAEILQQGDFEPVVPEGGYFMVADYTKLKHQMGETTSNDPADYQFVRWLCREKKLGLIPVSAFYSKEHKHLGENLVRFCFFKVYELLKRLHSNTTAFNDFDSSTSTPYWRLPRHCYFDQTRTDGEGLETDVKTFKEFLQQYNRVSEGCFLDCVHDFTTRTVSKKEEQCASNCMEKYLKMTQRISQRFQEFQMLQAEASGTSPLFQNKYLHPSCDTMTEAAGNFPHSFGSRSARQSVQSTSKRSEETDEGPSIGQQPYGYVALVL